MATPARAALANNASFVRHEDEEPKKASDRASSENWDNSDNSP